MKKKSILRRLVPWIVFLALAAAFVYFVGIPLYSQKDEQTTPLPTVAYFEGKAETITLENDALKFELDTGTTQFKITEKANGRVWTSIPEKAASDPVAKNSQANLYTLQSTLLMTYTDRDKGTADIAFNNYQRSIMNGNYEIGEVTDDSVEVIYSIGDISKVYLMPYAITEERYQMFTERMKDQLGLSKSKLNSKVGNIYNIYSPDTLATKTDAEKEAILAQYPSAAEQPLRVLDTTKKADYQSISDYFVQVGYTQEDYELDQQLIASASAVEKPVFNVTVRYILDGDDFVVEIPYDQIHYRANFPMTSITVLPMFGAAGLEDEGFMFIPEGGGALINLNNGKLSQNSYYANMYGWDWGTYRKEVINETQCAFPVFGVSKNGGSFICVMEGAASYGGVQADISQRFNSYNWVCAKYTVLHGDQYNVSNKTGTLVYMFEKQLPSDTIRQRYRFVDSGSYVDMAKSYGEYLRKTYPAMAERQLDVEMPVNVEFVGAIDKRVVKFGLPVDSVTPTTTFSEAETILGKLTDNQVKNLSVRMSGWANGGVNQRVLTSVRVLRELGGENGMSHLIDYAKQKSVPLYFDGISCFAYDSNLLDGFLVMRDAARYTTRERVQLYPYYAITYRPMEWEDPYYLVHPTYAKRMTSNLIDALKKRGAYGVAFRDLGSLLSGDYNVNDLTTREQVKQLQIVSLLEAQAAGEAVMIKEGFDYAMPYADLITDMDLHGTPYSIIDVSVPFYQIAIHGAVNYTGAPINLTSDWWTELLRSAEYGAGLNFTFMARDAKILQDTKYTGYFGAYYDAWDEEALQLIADYQQAMAGLNSQEIVGHERLSSTLTVTTYENGAKVYVNYDSEDITADGVSVPARSYIVKGGEAR
ncbi:MAG: hypothetical protein IJS41_09960 [Clostridia bacterium]|nr:hypothetical protein [Clostridia bacterium]